jgi:hypothetical protein
MATLTDCTFAELRPILAQLLRVPIDSIQPTMPISPYLPVEARSRFRRQLARASALKIPELTYRAATGGREAVFGICIRVATAVLAAFCDLQWFVIPIGVLSAAFSTALIDCIHRHYVAEENHPEIITFEDLARWVLARNMKRLRQRFNLKADHAEILVTIKAVLLEQMAVDPRRVKEDFCFAELD